MAFVNQYCFQLVLTSAITFHRKVFENNFLSVIACQTYAFFKILTIVQSGQKEQQMSYLGPDICLSYIKPGPNLYGPPRRNENSVYHVESFTSREEDILFVLLLSLNTNRTNKKKKGYIRQKEFSL